MDIFNESTPGIQESDIFPTIAIFIALLLIVTIIMFIKVFQEKNKELKELRNLNSKICKMNGEIITLILSCYKVIAQENSELITKEKLPNPEEFYEEKEILLFCNDIDNIQKTKCLEEHPEIPVKLEKIQEILEDFTPTRNMFSEKIECLYLSETSMFGKIISEVKRKEYLSLWNFYKKAYHVKDLEKNNENSKNTESVCC